MTIHNRYRLLSSDLLVEVVPSEGGRISSLRSLSSGMEFLTQSRGVRSNSYPRLGASFRNGPCAGIEECLPSVGACGPETIGGAVPDHGDFWQVAWRVLHYSERKLSQAAVGFSRPLRFEKSIEIESNHVRLDYSVQNIGAEPQSFLYACHPLFAVDAGDEITLPSEVSSLRLDYSRVDRLGMRGDIVSWPGAQDGVRLDRVGTQTDGTADMLYTGRLGTGQCSIRRVASGQELELRFNAQSLPYLGIWLCYGGWPEGEKERIQYAVALEPTSSPCNTLAEAQSNGTAISLQPQEIFRFDIHLTITDLDTAP